jgi:perosamine synthetase
MSAIFSSLIFSFRDDRIVQEWRGMIRFNKPTIGKKDLESVLYCMIKDDLAPGLHLKNFTTMLSTELNLSHVLAFASYLHTFETVFQLIGAQKGDEVILPSFARSNILHALLRCNMKPILVDIEQDSFLPSFQEMKRKVRARTRCILIPQMFGIPNDLSTYRELGLPLIEDIDGSLRAKVNGRPVGSFGDYITMNLNDYSIITTGSGGVLASRDRGLRQLFQSQSEDTDSLMSDFNASLGISQLNRLGKNIEARRKIGGYYDEAVFYSHCVLIGRDEGKELSFSSYVVKTETPIGECVHFFKKFGIPVRRGIETPLHASLGLPSKEYRNSEEMHNTLVALPIYPALTQQDIEKIVKGIKSIL